MVKQELRDVVMSLASCNRLGRKLGNTATQAHICSCCYKGTDDWKETVPCCEGEWRLERIILFVNIRVGFGIEQCLNCRSVAAPRRIHQSGVASRRLDLQIGAVL